MLPTNSQDKEQYKEHIQKHRFSTGNEAVNCAFEPSWVAAAFPTSKQFSALQNDPDPGMHEDARFRVTAPPVIRLPLASP